MGIVAYTSTEFNSEHKQAQSSAGGMSYQTPARNYTKESSNQYTNRGQCDFRVICCYRFTLEEMHIENPRIRIIY